MDLAKLLQVSIIVAAVLLSPARQSVGATDCEHGNALDCYTEAVHKLQTAEDAVSQTRKDIAELQKHVSDLSRSINDPNTGLIAQVVMLKSTNNDQTILNQNFRNLLDRIGSVSIVKYTDNNGTLSCDTYCEDPNVGKGNGTCFASLRVSDHQWQACSTLTGFPKGLWCWCGSGN
jgi:hypothetical protein